MKIFRWFWNHKIISIIILVLLLTLYWWIFIRNSNGELETATVERGDVVEELILSGQIVADEHAFLRYPASGKIAYVGVSEGEQVYKGQLLGRMDTTLLNSAYQQARANLRAAEANADAVLDSVKGHDSDESFNDRNTRTAAETAKDKAYEAYIQAEYNLRNSNLYAPFEGLVLTVNHPYPGVNFIASETIFEILNPETMYFSVSADQTEVDDISVGDKVRIVMDASSEKELTGTVSYISFAPTDGEIGSVYSIKVSLDALADGSFDYRVGMTGDAYFELNRSEGVLFVPPSFVQSSSDRDYLLIENGKKELDVQLGVEGEDRIEIRGEGLTEGLIIYD